MMNTSETVGEARRQFICTSLGLALGQCCGGTVRLSLKRFDAHDAKWIVSADDVVRQHRSLRHIVSADPAIVVEAGAADATTAGVQPDASGLTQTVPPLDMSIVLCGAGHVGHAIVRTLAHLPCRITWADKQDVMFPFPTEVSPNVVVEPTGTPEAVIDHVPAGNYFLVMAHNYALDLALCERIMRHADFAYFGPIGSKTKHMRFGHRMVEHDVDSVYLPEMVCPIGVVGIADKALDIIAVSIIAQLLQVQEL